MSKPGKVIRPAEPTVKGSAFSTCWALLGLAFLVLAVYGNTLFAGFVSDDKVQLVRNGQIKSIQRIPEMLLSGSQHFMGGTSNYYRPTQGLAYLAVYHLRGLDAFSFHLLMLLLHLATTVLVYLLVRQLGSERTALAAGALFAVHPIHTEVVDWIAAFPDAFMTPLIVMAVWLFARQNGSPQKLQAAGHCGLYLLAVFSKEPGVMLLPLYLGFEWICLRRTLRDLRANAALYAGMLAVLMFYLAARYYAIGGLAPYAFVLSPFAFVLSVVVTAGEYLGKLVAPVNLNYFHVFEATRSIDLKFLVSLSVILAVAAAFFALRRRSATQADNIPQPVLLAYGIWWIAITLAPPLNITRVSENVLAERYLYLPSVGFVWIAAIAWEWFSKRNQTAAYAVGALLLGFFSLATISRNRDWHDDLTLMQVTVRQSPQSAAVHDNLANDYVEAGNQDEAVAEERLASKLAPNSWRYHLNLGNLLISRDSREAVQECEEALKSAPGLADANYCIGLAWKAAGDSTQAASAYERALATTPTYYPALLSLSRLYWESGRVEDAIGLIQRAARARPQEPEPLIRLAVLFSDSGRDAEAAQSAQSGLALSPDPDLAYYAHYVLGVFYRKSGSLPEAASEFSQAYQARPDRQAAKVEYGSVLSQMGQK